MAEFDESKVINGLHTDKAEVGKKYWFADNMTKLKGYIERDHRDFVYVLGNIREDLDCPFAPSAIDCAVFFAFVYPYEEPSEELMSNRQMAEWVTRGNGQYTSTYCDTAYTEHDYYKDYDDEKVPSKYRIRPWGSDEWVVPTVAIYERDCKR